MMKRELFLAGVLILFGAARAFSTAGEIIDVSFDRTMTVAQINAAADELFEGMDAPKARYEVDIYFIEYETTGLEGDATPALLQLFVPRILAPSRLPLYVFATGSTGLVDACRPSREHVAGIHWGLYRTHVLAHAAQGTVGVMPDYMNFSVTGEIQPYFISVAEARVLLDAIRVSKAFIAGTDYRAQPAPGAFVAGYSQGGHAAFAAADLRSEYAPDVEIAGVIGYGPSTDIFSLFKEFTVSAPLVIYSYAWFYGEDVFDPAVMLRDRWLDSLPNDVTTQCIGAIQRFYPLEPAPLFRPAFTEALLDGTLFEVYPEIARLMALNSSGLSGHGIPALILAGTEDIVVFPDSQTKFVRDLCAAGSDVRYVVYEGARHDTRQIGFWEAAQWMQTVTAGGPTGANCEDYR